LAAAALEADEEWAKLAGFARDWAQSSTHDPEPLLTLSKALFHTGKLREAVEPARQALQFDPDHTESWFHLAHIYAKLNDSAERDKAVARVVALSPDRAGDLEELGVAARTANDCSNSAATSAGC
jgi:Flp pilus assembly protein TadD